MNTKQEANVAILKAYAEANYNNGMDTLVECWNSPEYIELLDDCGGDVEEAKKCMDDLGEIFSEQQAGARNSAF